MGDDLKGMLKRHEAFWRGEGERALRQVTAFQPLEEQGNLPLADGSRAKEGQALTPDMIDPRRFYGDAEPMRRRGLPDVASGGRSAGDGEGSPIRGDFMTGSAPPGLCWTEAIIGCPVRMVTGGAWAEPFFEEKGDPADLQPDARWLGKLDEFVDFLVGRADGRYPVGQPLFRGPVDMMAAALGHERMCVALMEDPAWTDAFLGRCAEMFIEVARRRLAHTPAFEGGYLSAYGIWAPGTVVRTQLDNATLLSPEVYRERALPHDRRVIEAFDFPLIHVHSCCLHIVDDLLGVEALRAIQVSIDYPGGPLASDVLPVFGDILKVKPLIVTGPVTRGELEALEGLEPSGRLCLQAQVIEGRAGG